MANIPALTTFVAGTVINPGQVNDNFAEIRNAFNDTAVLTDVARTVVVTHTYSQAVPAKFSAWSDGSLVRIDSGDGSLTELGIGSEGQILRAGASDPAYTTATFPDDAAQGDLLYGSAGSTWSRLAKGTANQALLMNAGATAPEWRTFASGSMVFLAEATASGDATIDFTSDIDGTYDEYIITLLNVIPASSSQALWMRTSTDAGSSWDSGASDYEWAEGYNTVGSATQAGSGADAKIVVASNGLASGANDMGYSGVIHLIRPSEATYTVVHGGGVAWAANASVTNFIGQRLSAADVDGIRFLFASGNIASGIFKLYGVQS